MSHFEEVLKVVGLMKSFVMKCDPHVSRHTGNDVIYNDVIISHSLLLLQATSRHCLPQKSWGPCCMPPAPN